MRLSVGLTFVGRAGVADGSGTGEFTSTFLADEYRLCQGHGKQTAQHENGYPESQRQRLALSDRSINLD